MTPGYYWRRYRQGDAWSPWALVEIIPQNRELIMGSEEDGPVSSSSEFIGPLAPPECCPVCQATMRRYAVNWRIGAPTDTPTDITGCSADPAHNVGEPYLSQLARRAP